MIVYFVRAGIAAMKKHNKFWSMYNLTASLLQFEILTKVVLFAYSWNVFKLISTFFEQVLSQPLGL